MLKPLIGLVALLTVYAMLGSIFYLAVYWLAQAVLYTFR